ncbi:MAG TPA: phosphatidylserine decarboxylase family protein [Candidatus Limnocylindrales bacterium]|nr:phosphatidylserine decarboxylase family protein [Candidatus Limnocylindrales bacterium]
MPIAKEGYIFITIPLILTLILFLVPGWRGSLLSWLSLAVTLLMINFFRDPERKPPETPGVIVSPADGKIVQVVEADRRELKGRYQQVSIFMSPLDVHVNRSPITGVVESITYIPGRFLPAFRDKASELNEQTSIILTAETPHGPARVMVKQIAGLLARRIVCWLRQGDKVTTGQRIGLIKFSSRVDLFLPTTVQLQIKVGDKVKAGTSIIGRW